MEQVLVILILLVSPFPCRKTYFSCPEVVELNRDTTLTCSFQGPTTIHYNPRNKAYVAHCLNSGGCGNQGNPRYKPSFINANTSHLVISKVNITDEGNWTCLDVNTDERSTCPLVVRKTPSCDMNSDTDMGNLSVTVVGYYCSLPVTFRLKTNTYSQELLTNHPVKTVTNYTVSLTPLNATRSWLLFICNNVELSLPCGGMNIKTDGSSFSGERNETSLLPDGVVIVSVISVGGVIVIVITTILNRKKLGKLYSAAWTRFRDSRSLRSRSVCKMEPNILYESCSPDTAAVCDLSTTSPENQYTEVIKTRSILQIKSSTTAVSKHPDNSSTYSLARSPDAEAEESNEDTVVVLENHFAQVVEINKNLECKSATMPVDELDSRPVQSIQTVLLNSQK